MELYNKNVGDITYMSELTLDIFQGRNSARKCQGLNSHLQLKKNKGETTYVANKLTKAP